MQSGPDQLRDWIERRGFKQYEAADFLGVGEVYLSQLLNGRRRPGLDHAVNLERKTGITVDSWALSEVSEESGVSPDASENPPGSQG